MRLYIAEKPSMGQEIAKCLNGPMRRGDGFIETGDGIVTWVFGHILRQADPQEYDDKYKFWREADLPIVPEKWKMLIADNCAKQFGIIKGLVAKADEIVHAGDPDREGQLLVDEVLDYLGNKKPVRRILLNALDERSIKSANANLRNNSDFWNLKQSALARSRADWLIGMNLSRAYTLAARRSTGEKIVLPVGRVKTPTLSLVVRREREIQNFKPVDYYGIKGDFQHKNGMFTAVWKPKDTMAGLDSEGRLTDKKIAEEKLQEFLHDPRQGTITSYSKAKKQESQKLPFSLSSLQVMAGKRFGYAPQQVLDTAQRLYEKKLTSYPRSDCEYLPTNQMGDSNIILKNLANFGDAQLADWVSRADLSIKSRAWNDKKISAHHAIIPTRVPVSGDKLSAMERNIYFLVAQAYIAQFYPVHTYNQTKVEVTYHDELFTVSGRVVLEVGWKELYGFGKEAKKADKDNDKDEEKEEDEAVSLPAMKKNDKVDYLEGKLISKVTKPPVRFTPSTLLAAMKEIHKFVKDPEAKKKLKDVYGIGTEATRATIIEDLIKRKFLTATGKKQVLTPNDSAYLLVDAMPDELSYPDFTAIWEDKLHSMAEGDGNLDEFIKGQVEFTAALCAKANRMVLENTGSVATSSGGKNDTSKKSVPAEGQQLCPRCKQGILTKRHGKNGDFWGCSMFPKCRMTCNDRGGKPDMDDANNRMSGRRTFASNNNSIGNTYRTPVQSYSSAESEIPVPEYNPSDYGIPDYEPPMAYSGYSTPDDEDYSVLDGYDPYAGFENSGFSRFNNKPKTSAMPMEKLAMKEAATKNSSRKSADANKYLCPHCKEGHLRSIKGRNGTFWGCTNYPRCTATYDDVNGMPLLGKL